MVKIREYGETSEAWISKGLLENYGIRAEVVSNASSSVFPAPDAGIDVSSLYVDEADRDRALELLAEHGD